MVSLSHLATFQCYAPTHQQVLGPQVDSMVSFLLPARLAHVPEVGNTSQIHLVHDIGLVDCSEGLVRQPYCPVRRTCRHESNSVDSVVSSDSIVDIFS